MADKKQCIRGISSFLSRTTAEVEKILTELQWTKGYLLKGSGSSKLVQCPLNSNHLVQSRHLNKHLNVCKFASKEINLQEIPCSPEFFYKSCNTVIPVSIGERQYSFFKNWKEGSTVEVPKEDQTTDVKPLTAVGSDVKSMGAPTRKIEGKIGNDKTSMDNRRSIMAWRYVPPSYERLDIHLLPQENVKTWIVKNVPRVQYLSSVEGATDHLVKFVMSCLQETRVAHPAGMEEMLNDLLGNETKSFVLELWKFLSVSISDAKLNRPEALDDKLVQEPLTNSAAPSEHATGDLIPTCKTEVPLPMDRVLSELSPQQRLAVYEHVVQTAKTSREEREKGENLDAVDEISNPQEEDKDHPKSHLEVLAERRDYKRRRQTYRAKNVHITKRSAVEVMRDLIETQMSVLESQLKGEQGTSRTNSDDEDKSSEDRSYRPHIDRGEHGREDGRGYEKSRTNRDRRREREGNKRSRDYDGKDTDNKRSRR